MGLLVIMLKFYKTEGCTGCQDIEDALKELCIEHQVTVVKETNDIPSFIPSGTRLPFLVDEGLLLEGTDDIIDHLSELEEFKDQWYKFQSDACYCDEEGDKRS